MPYSATGSTHGKKAYIAIASAATPDTVVNVSSRAYNVRNAFRKDLADSSTFGLDDKTFESGMREATITLDIRSADDIETQLFDIYMSDAPVLVIFGPEGNASGDRRFSAYFHMEGYEPGASINDVEGGSVTLRRTAGTTKDTF